VRRALLGVLSLGWLPLSGFAWYAVTFPPQRPPDLFRQALLVIASEFLLALFMASAIGLMWAIAAPKWVAMLADHMAKQLSFLLLFLVLLALAAVAVVAVLAAIF
jgi:membrane-bound metal-dependent hydrolase YbcI (DUF457 family)